MEIKDKFDAMLVCDFMSYCMEFAINSSTVDKEKYNDMQKKISEHFNEIIHRMQTK